MNHDVFLGKRRAGQISIEYVAGFMMFILIITFVIFAVMSIFPKYHEESKNNALREDAWALSENVMHYLVIGTEINETRLDWLRDVGVAHTASSPSMLAYYDLKDGFSVDMEDDFRVTVTVNPVLATEMGTRSGEAYFDGSKYVFEINDVCDNVTIFDGSGMVVDSAELNNQLSIDVDYNVERIDSRCEYAILAREVADAGKPVPMTADSSKILRFSNYDGFMARIDITYW